MELREPIEDINKKLIEHYGRSIDDGRPNFRVVWSMDQYEKRWTKFTDTGVELLEPEVRLLPKYRQYIRDKYILERLQPVIGETDLIEKVVYEVVWTFGDKNGNYLPPWFEACKHIIENILMNMGARNYYAKYKDTMSKEEYLAQIQKMEDELFGNETDMTDDLSIGSGISMAGLDGTSKLTH